MVGRMPLSSADAVVAAGAAAVVLIAILGILLSRRSTARRLAALTARMGESDLQFGGRAGLETGLAKLERVVDSTVAVGNEARSGQALLEQALAAVPQGVVVGNDQGTVIFENDAAVELLDKGAGGPRGRDAVLALLEAAADGRSDTSSIDLEGP